MVNGDCVIVRVSTLPYSLDIQLNTWAYVYSYAYPIMAQPAVERLDWQTHRERRVPAVSCRQCAACFIFIPSWIWVYWRYIIALDYVTFVSVGVMCNPNLDGPCRNSYLSLKWYRQKHGWIDMRRAWHTELSNCFLMLFCRGGGVVCDSAG